MALKSRIFFLFFSCWAFVPKCCFSQLHLRDSVLSFPLIYTSYALQIPGGGISQRFGINSNLEFQFLYKTDKNWIWGFSGDYIFGNHVKANGILDSISTSSGFLIGSNGNLADKQLSEEGFTAFLKLGKLLPEFGPNPNSGIMLLGGLGMLEDHIRIDLVEGTDQDVPQLNAMMRKGYDRLSNGLAIDQFAGYLFLGNRRIANFFAGLEFTEAFTKDRRFDYDLMKQNTTLNTDFLFGIRAGWVLPLYRREPKEYYTY